MLYRSPSITVLGLSATKFEEEQSATHQDIATLFASAAVQGGSYSEKPNSSFRNQQPFENDHMLNATTGSGTLSKSSAAMAEKRGMPSEVHPHASCQPQSTTRCVATSPRVTHKQTLEAVNLVPKTIKMPAKLTGFFASKLAKIAAATTTNTEFLPLVDDKKADKEMAAVENETRKLDSPKDDFAAAPFMCSSAFDRQNAFDEHSKDELNFFSSDKNTSKSQINHIFAEKAEGRLCLLSDYGGECNSIDRQGQTLNLGGHREKTNTNKTDSSHEETSLKLPDDGETSPRDPAASFTGNDCNTDSMVCDKCGKIFTVWEMPEHSDYHFALELQNSSEHVVTHLSAMVSSNIVKPAKMGVKRKGIGGRKPGPKSKLTKGETQNKTLLCFFSRT